MKKRAIEDKVIETVRGSRNLLGVDRVVGIQARAGGKAPQQRRKVRGWRKSVETATHDRHWLRRDEYTHDTPVKWPRVH